MSVVKGRRKALRSLMLLTVGLSLRGEKIISAKGGELTVDLGQWERVTFRLHGRQIAVTVHEVFDALS